MSIVYAHSWQDPEGRTPREREPGGLAGQDGGYPLAPIPAPARLGVQRTPLSEKTMRNERRTYSGILGAWQRLLDALSANTTDLPHLEMARSLFGDHL